MSASALAPTPGATPQSCRYAAGACDEDELEAAGEEGERHEEVAAMRHGIAQRIAASA